LVFLSSGSGSGSGSDLPPAATTITDHGPRASAFFLLAAPGRLRLHLRLRLRLRLRRC
jgi:hypothetical protein